MKVGDRVVMKRWASPKSTFRTGVVMDVDPYSVRIKRDDYRGHEYTWWTKDQWRKIRNVTNVKD